VFDSLITAGNSFQIVGAEKLKELLLLVTPSLHYYCRDKKEQNCVFCHR